MGISAGINAVRSHYHKLCHVACSRHICRRLTSFVAEDLLSIATDKVNASRWGQAPMCWARFYTDASILKAFAIILKAKPEASEEVAGTNEESFTDDELNSLVATLDKVSSR
jgi:hypothetical protein